MTAIKAKEVTVSRSDVPTLEPLPRPSSNVEAWLYQPGEIHEGLATDRLGRTYDTSYTMAARLWVRFKGGGLYRYWGVPPILFETLKVAPSIGGMLNDKVVGNQDYQCEKIVVGER